MNQPDGFACPGCAGPYRGVFRGRKVEFMNEEDMVERNIAANALVEIEAVPDTEPCGLAP
jgi:hypothetical protein